MVSHLTALCSMFVLFMSERRIEWFTVSKALEKSTAIDTVWWMG